MNKTVLFFISIFLCYACSHKPSDSGTVIQHKDGAILSISGKRNISGIYPHLTTYAHSRVDGSYGYGNECGIGALAVWQDKLFMINYAAHQPEGSEHNLYIINKDLDMEVFPESIGGTPAARMVHQESGQLLIGPYLIDEDENIRVISYEQMPGRLTAIARHLHQPDSMVYYYDMEGKLYEANVYTLEVNTLFENPLPGWHGKGGYTSQGRLVVSNNGESSGDQEVKQHWKVESKKRGPEDYGSLASYDGNNWRIIERRQYTDVTTKHGVNAVPNDQSPLWSMGWDKRSVRLKVLDDGNWHTYLLPKATYNNDPSHGWFTEWPRIRQIGEDQYLMDMHGMFYDFPSTFSASNTAGIAPVSSHLRYIPDFVNWKEQLVLATDETSIQGNPLAGQPQSNLWFGTIDDTKQWGPATGYGAVWLEDDVKAGVHSLPYLFNGFENRMLHLVNHNDYPVTVTVEMDKAGDNTWETLKSITLKPNNYHYEIFDDGQEGQWVRLKTNEDATLTASFHYTDNPTYEAGVSQAMFDPIADADFDGEVSFSKLYSNRQNFNLSVFAEPSQNADSKQYEAYEFTKYDFTYKRGIEDSTAVIAKEVEKIWSVDEASVILRTSEGVLRLPKGNAALDQTSSEFRAVREVESERILANIHGTFYEVPLFKVGEEPLYHMLRPVSTHNKQISDYNTWNGLLVMSGVMSDAGESEHVYKNEAENVALWFGGIDDIWGMGKPAGIGGPWYNTEVQANELSDKYLMTGYDEKTLELRADKDVTISVYIQVAHYTDTPVLYSKFDVKKGESLTHKFPDGFSAHWVQLSADKNCIVTSTFRYE